MNYTEIVATAIAYADRDGSTEVESNMDNFLRIVEARINKTLKVQEMTARANLVTVADQEYYALPSDFRGMRDIEIRDSLTARARETLQYVSPDVLNAYSGDADSTSPIVYSIIANQLQIMPPQDSKILEMIYYRKVPALTSSADSNWLSEENPDCYIFGLLVEINSFVKDAEAKVLWEERFMQSVAEIQANDYITRWSGPPMMIVAAN